MASIPDQIREFLRSTATPPTPLQRQMAEHADRNGFPIVGPTVGNLLALLAAVGKADSVFEFGSGFGYSASWFLRGMPTDGRIVLTERDADELELARSFFTEAGEVDRVRFEQGDALDIVQGYEGPFDIVLIDHEKARYVEAVEAVRGKLRPGSLVIADNMLSGPFAFAEIADGVDGKPVTDDRVRGIVNYLEHVRTDDAFMSSVVPLGSGIAISARLR